MDDEEEVCSECGEELDEWARESWEHLGISSTHPEGPVCADCQPDMW